MLTNDVRAADNALGQTAFHLDSKGSVIFPVTIYTCPDAIYLDVEGEQSDVVINALEKYLVMERCKLECAAETQSGVWLYGDLLSMTNHPFTAVAGGHVYKTSIGTESLLAMQQRRSDQPMWLIFGSSFGLNLLFDELGAIEMPIEWADELRISAGIPAGTQDFSGMLAMETGVVERTIAFNKGCYIGQEVVARIDSRGKTHRSLYAIDLEGAVGVDKGIYCDDKVVGDIRSLSTMDGVTKAIARMRSDALSSPLTVNGVPVNRIRMVQ